jgi:hypothetical protein
MKTKAEQIQELQIEIERMSLNYEALVRQLGVMNKRLIELEKAQKK